MPPTSGDRRADVISRGMEWLTQGTLSGVSGKAEIGVSGLATMGRNLARNLARHGHVVALHNRTYQKTMDLVDNYSDEGTFIGAETAQEFVDALEKPRRIVVLVPAGKATDAVIDEFVPLLDEGDVVIDAGNAHFLDTRRREKALSEKGLNFVGMGVSGRRGGRPQRPLDHAGWAEGGLRRARSAARGHLGRGRRQALLHPHRRRRRGPLREDGPQRHRVLRHAAHRRGLRPAAQGPGHGPGGDLRGVPRPGTRGASTRT